LVFRSKIIVIEYIIPNRTLPASSLGHWRKPDGRETSLAQLIGLLRKMVPPNIDFVAIRRGRYAGVTSLVKSL
jgi:hypothetical protein